MKRRRTIAATLVAASLAVGGLAPAAALAEGGQWRDGGLGADGTTAGASHSTLTSSKGVSVNQTWLSVDVGAHYPGGWNLAFPYTRAQYTACQNYVAQNLGPIIHNPHTVTNTRILGIEGWYGSYATYC